MKVGKYNYPNDATDIVKIDKKLKEEFSKFCKANKIIKSKLIEKFYRTILIRAHDGSLNASKANLTIHLLRGTICKGKSDSAIIILP